MTAGWRELPEANRRSPYQSDVSCCPQLCTGQQSIGRRRGILAPAHESRDMIPSRVRTEVTIGAFAPVNGFWQKPEIWSLM